MAVWALGCTAHQNAQLLLQGSRVCWAGTCADYVRCHDDIGFGAPSGYEPAPTVVPRLFHGQVVDGQARGLAFNPADDFATGDARSLGSSWLHWRGLEPALEAGRSGA